MSRSKRQLSNEQLLHAVTKGAGEPEKPLPDTIALSRSQVYSLNALANDETNFNAQIRQHQEKIGQLENAIRQTQAARGEVLGEIASASGVSVADIGANYQSDGQGLVKASKQE